MSGLTWFRASYARDVGYDRDRKAAYYQANREQILQYYRDNRAGISARRRDRRYGMAPGEWDARYEAQGGACYLCGDPLPADRSKVATDHDHSCCPGTGSCGACVRGLACVPCNTLIARASDDPRRLRRIADRLEQAQLARLAG